MCLVRIECLPSTAVSIIYQLIGITHETVQALARKRRSRRMSIENLENRSLMAGDFHHNFVLPEDADASGVVSPVDALVVINRVNRSADRCHGLPSIA